ncbi:MAG: cation-transporting P-type ATPase, partial [Patescibacteria group bacterium]
LNKVLTPKAKVVRDGEQEVIDARQVVPGDVVILEVGEKAAADGKIISADSLSLNEAILTGESRAVNKKTGDEVFMGTIIESGVGRMKVEQTGQKTKVGQIAESLKETKEAETPLQKQLRGLAGKLTWVVVAAASLILGVGWLRGDEFEQIFTTAVAVAVSAIPEGLVIALTVILALGMQRILKRKALVRQLAAAETLGGVTVICCDKTGTLTEGKMKVVGSIRPLNSELDLKNKGHSPFEVMNSEDKLRLAAGWCNDMRDPLEIAMNKWSGVEPAKSRLDEIPFSHEKKYIATLYPGLLLVSGAPEVILAKCQISKAKFPMHLKEFKIEASKGHRLVGFAYKNIEAKKIEEKEVKNLTWLGILVFDDPVRLGVKAALDDTRKMGIKIKVITGDFKETAEAVAGQLGIKPEDVYSRVTPQEKLKIVSQLQQQGEIVAMMGDGVNDAPALKKADIGIVVADASAVAQETADMVLLDSNFGTIAAAVEEGRGIFANISKVLFYLMANSLAEVVLILGSMLFNLPLPLTAAQILWINLVNDSWPAFALTVDLRRPKRISKILFGRQAQIAVVFISFLTGIIALALFYVFRSQALIFTVMAVAPLIYCFSIGSVKNIWLIAAVITGLMFQALVLYWPVLQTVFKTTALGGTEWLVVIGSGLAITAAMEIIKMRFYKI